MNTLLKNIDHDVNDAAMLKYIFSAFTLNVNKIGIVVYFSKVC